MSPLLYILVLAQAIGLLAALTRIVRLTRAAKHHEHVLRLTLETLASTSGLHQPAHDFALMVLNEEAWDARTRLLGSPLVATPKRSTGERDG